MTATVTVKVYYYGKFNCDNFTNSNSICNSNCNYSLAIHLQQKSVTVLWQAVAVTVIVTVITVTATVTEKVTKRKCHECKMAVLFAWKDVFTNQIKEQTLGTLVNVTRIKLPYNSIQVRGSSGVITWCTCGAFQKGLTLVLEIMRKDCWGLENFYF